MSERPAKGASLVALLDRPLVHFLLLGTAVFWMRIAIARPDASARTIEVTPAVRAELRRELEVELGRRATVKEFDTAFERWKLDEVAYREALRMELKDDDPVIKRQLITKFLEVNLQLQPLPEPSEAELDAWLAAHRDDYLPEPRYDFEHVFVKGVEADSEQRARELARDAKGGKDPRTMGERFHFGRTFLGRSRASIEVEFGLHFAARLEQLDTGNWQVLRSKHGWHAVRVNKKSGGRLPERAVLRRSLYRDFREHARQQSFQRQLEELERSYRFVEPSQ